MLKSVKNSLVKTIPLALFLLLLYGCAAPPKKAPIPESNAQPSAEYHIGIDDVIAVSVWRNPELSVTGPVRPDGKITMPIIGDVQAGGKTPEQVAAAIRERLGQYLREPQVAVSVVELVSHTYLTRIRVTGAVAQPVSIPHRPGMTVLDAVLAAGGVTEFAAPNRTTLYRKQEGKSRAFPVYLKEILYQGKLETNYELMPGDIISIPERRF